MSAAVISRYRNGERVPNLNSNQLEQLSDGLYKIALNKGIDIPKEDILANLSKTLKEKNIDFDQLRENLNSLITLLNINIWINLKRGFCQILLLVIMKLIIF